MVAGRASAGLAAGRPADHPVRERFLCDSPPSWRVLTVTPTLNFEFTQQPPGNHIFVGRVVADPSCTQAMTISLASVEGSQAKVSYPVLLFPVLLADAESLGVGVASRLAKPLRSNARWAASRSCPRRPGQ